jgi:hypothetical protein
MDIELEKIEIAKLIMECDNPIILRKVRDILQKGLNKNLLHKTKKDIK